MPGHLVIHSDLLALKPHRLLTLIALAKHMDNNREVNLKPSQFAGIFGRELTLNSPEHMVSDLKRIEYKGQPLLKTLGRHHYQILTPDIHFMEVSDNG